MNQVKRMMVTALLMACGVVLPMMLHSIPNAGRILLPMHIPVLLCGLYCGGLYGLICGVFTPLLSFMMTSMPGPGYLLPMMVELAVYGLVSGIMMDRVHSVKGTKKVLLCLVIAMLAGRIVYGLMNALVLRAGQYSIAMWVSASFVTAAPGIAAQLILIPLIMKLLKRNSE